MVDTDGDLDLIRAYCRARALARRSRTKKVRRVWTRHARRIGHEVYDAAVLRSVARIRGSDTYPAVYVAIGVSVWVLPE